MPAESSWQVCIMEDGKSLYFGPWNEEAQASGGCLWRREGGGGWLLGVLTCAIPSCQRQRSCRSWTSLHLQRMMTRVLPANQLLAAAGNVEERKTVKKGAAATRTNSKLQLAATNLAVSDDGRTAASDLPSSASHLPPTSLGTAPVVWLCGSPDSFAARRRPAGSRLQDMANKGKKKPTSLTMAKAIRVYARAGECECAHGGKGASKSRCSTVCCCWDCASAGAAVIRAPPEPLVDAAVCAGNSSPAFRRHPGWHLLLSLFPGRPDIPPAVRLVVCAAQCMPPCCCVAPGEGRAAPPEREVVVACGVCFAPATGSSLHDGCPVCNVFDLIGGSRQTSCKVFPMCTLNAAALDRRPAPSLAASAPSTFSGCANGHRMPKAGTRRLTASPSWRMPPTPTCSSMPCW